MSRTNELRAPLLESYDNDEVLHKERRRGARCVLLVPVLLCAGLGAASWRLGARWPPPPPKRCAASFSARCGAAACAVGAVAVALAVVAALLRRRRRVDPRAAPQDAAGFASTYTFWWMTPTLRAANAKGRLDAGDLPKLPRSDGAARLARALKATWLERPGGAGSLFVALLARMQPRVVLGALGHGWLFLSLMFLDPIILRRLLDGAGADSAAAARRNLGYAAALSASMFVRVACMEVCFFGSVRAMNNCRTAIVPLVFRAAVGGRTDEDSGKLTNLMATDADKLGRWSWTLFFAAQWSFAVVSLPAVAYCMYDLLGAAALVGAATVVAANQAALEIGKRTKPAVLRLQEARDARAKLTTEMLAGVRLAKLRGWTAAVRARVAAAREAEMAALKTTRYLDALNVFVGCVAALAVPVAIFSWYALVEKKSLSPAVAFTALAWITQMEWSINTLPDIYNLWSSLSPSVERLADFLLRAPKDAGAPPPFPSDAAAAVDGAVGYGARAVATAKFECRRGEVVAVVGPVGSGKSTLLRSLCGADAAVDGWAGTAPGLARAYVGQDPFLLTGTIVDNVAFGLPVDDARVDACLRDCGLGPDLAALPDGRLTPVGPSGVRLSGGQRSRVALARALYAEPDVLVLDDVFSAVDAHTGAALWERAIAPLAGRCAVVLATHQLAYAARPEVSRVVDLGPRGAAAPSRSIEEAKEAPAVEAAPVAETSVETQAPARREPVALEEVAAELRRLLAAREGETVDGALATRLERSLLGLDGDEPERRRGGFIAYRDFVLYLDAFGSRATSAGLAAIAVAACACAVASNVWLSVWADDGAEGAAQTRFLVVYAAIGVLQAGLLALQTILLTLCALDASKTLHEKMLDGVLGAPLRFFDETPQGNALNRFLQDLANVDVDVPTVFLDQLTRTLTVASQLGLVLYFAPWVALMLPLALVPYGFIFSTVRVAARDTRRLEAAAHGPCYAHFDDALRGRETVAAFGALDRFCDANARLVEAMATGKYANDACSKWSQALTTMNGCFLYLAAGLCAVVLVRRGDVSTGQLGLVLLYAASLQRAGMDYMCGLATLEAQFVSVERVAEYCRLARERDDGRGRAPAAPGSAAALVATDVALRYRLSRPLALRGVCLTVAPGEKVAVLGRTGSGKSSLVGALARLYPLAAGAVTVGGVDLAGLPLADARARVRVVEQCSTLARETVRANLLGPSATCGDEAVWAALDRVGVAAAVRRLPGGLDHVCAERGDDFSAGERQLLALARALLPFPPPLLLCDEATANVDEATDAKVHEVLLRGLDATVLVVCHRLAHVAAFDLAVVLDDGRVVEEGRPADLLRDPASRLAGLVAAGKKGG